MLFLEVILCLSLKSLFPVFPHLDAVRLDILFPVTQHASVASTPKALLQGSLGSTKSVLLSVASWLLPFGLGNWVSPTSAALSYLQGTSQGFNSKPWKCSGICIICRADSAAMAAEIGWTGLKK